MSSFDFRGEITYVSLAIGETMVTESVEEKLLGVSEAVQSKVSTSLVSKTGMISLTTFENENQSLVLKQVLESIF